MAWRKRQRCSFFRKINQNMQNAPSWATSLFIHLSAQKGAYFHAATLCPNVFNCLSLLRGNYRTYVTATGFTPVSSQLFASGWLQPTYSV